MITVTTKAIAEVRKLMSQETTDGELSLRVGVKGGGCSGLSYVLDFVKETRPNDKIMEFDGMKVVMDPKSAIYLNGTELDFTDGLSGSGFTFNNPNAQRTCGCGSSFAM